MKMSSLKFSMIFVFLLSLSSSLLTFTIAADPTYLYHVCSKSNFTRNSTYHSNLNLLLSSLPSNANRSDGFSNSTVGQDPNRVYGLFQCRGDVTTATCKDCVAFAFTDLAQRCPAQKRAVIWYDECLVHYSDSYIFSTAASSPSVRMWNTNNVTTEPSRFHELVLGMMNEATTQADLSNTNCSRCLHEAIANLPNESIGGRTLTPSCNCRYELYLFYNENLSLSSPAPAPAPAPSPPSPVTRPKGKSGLSTPIITAIVAPITVFAVLFVAGLLTRRASRKKYNSVPDEIDSNLPFGCVAGNDITTIEEALQFDFGTMVRFTSGYMSPEYAMHGQFYVKSDVFSFGVLVLEIITGKRNSNFYQTDDGVDLLSYVSKNKKL
ncbi:hypothetical protein EZV62_026420 [Acer yangbiense]|uniref:Gnk2-homologous domain-containing protein n=1 Tax=Acer yangbiense TaxID=1000413 RepID=A0A5C7GSH3_9ROSI|nr:hypothetical protein EZV62_026420 [Acer yangbiense]